MKPFPVPLHGNNVDGDRSHPLCRQVWIRVKPKDFVWYFVEGELMFWNRLRLRVYGTADNFWGGMGKQIHAETVDLTPEEAQEAQEYIKNYAHHLAEMEIDKEDRQARQRRIEKRRKAMFGV